MRTVSLCGLTYPKSGMCVYVLCVCVEDGMSRCFRVWSGLSQEWDVCVWCVCVCMWMGAWVGVSECGVTYPKSGTCVWITIGGCWWEWCNQQIILAVALLQVTSAAD